MEAEANKHPISASPLNSSMPDLEPYVLGNFGHGHLLTLGPTRAGQQCSYLTGSHLTVENHVL